MLQFDTHPYLPYNSIMSSTISKRIGLVFVVLVAAATVHGYKPFRSSYDPTIEASPFEATVADPSPGATPIPTNSLYTPSPTLEDPAYDEYEEYYETVSRVENLDIDRRQGDEVVLEDEQTVGATYPGYPPMEGFPGYTSSGTNSALAAATCTPDFPSDPSQATPLDPPAPIPLPTPEEM
ncbi:hypothetical protein QCA50_010561 [Cerrena zonata]|uniref:Uncharacterized protein n=1 Tax=Cerrena zonata TaxID=2478898 RepID=A0AAW0G915_9APHY